ERREGAVERQDFEAVARQVQLADDLRPQQRNHIGADGKLEARKDLFGHRRAAHDAPALEHQHLLPGASQVGRVDQAVVAAAYDDDVVAGIHGFARARLPLVYSRCLAWRENESTFYTER